MRHDAGACGAVIGQLDEPEVLAVVHAGVKSQTAYGGGNRCQCISYVTLHLAACHLGIYHVVVHGLEAKKVCGHLAVERER